MSKLDDILQPIVSPYDDIPYKQQIKDLFLELIGEDQKHILEARIDNDLEHGEHVGALNGRNELRAKLRKKVETL